MTRVLIVEDESLVALEIESALKKEGFFVCGVVDNGDGALDKVRDCHPDVVLMDIYLNGSMDGVEVCKRIKSLFDIPIIYLTAYSDMRTVNEAIECKPDGYLVKPFRRGELIATIKLALQKSRLGGEELVKVCDDVYYDKQAFQVVKDKERVNLTKKEAELLELCLSKKGKVVQFDELEYALWPDTPVADATRRTLIHRLRSKLFGKCLKTVPGIGCKIDG